MTELPEGWFPHFDSFRHANASGGCEVQFRAGQLHVSEVYVDPQAPLGFSVPLAVLRAALATQGLAIVDAKDRAVLEAMSHVPDEMLRNSIEYRHAHEASKPVAKAELARRKP